MPFWWLEKKKKTKLYCREKENWFKELLHKLKILKPKYVEMPNKIEEFKLNKGETKNET